MTAPTPCPACAGLSEPGHPGGVLNGWHHAPDCALLAHEDGQRVADSEVLADRYRYVRPATTTERQLLDALGHPGADAAGLLTTVRELTPGVGRRTWPA